MIRPRLIPCLLIRNKGLVKTVEFGKPKYVGDPLNAVRIFNEKQVDEIIVIDIDATSENRAPNMTLISQLASECNMPLCYGGGVNTVDQIQEIVSLGVEKVAIGAAAIEKPSLISDAAEMVGSQSVVGVLDVRKTGLLRKQSVVIRNGSVALGKNPVDVAIKYQNAGAGELLVNSVDHDGKMQGYDLELIKSVVESVSIPVTSLGGVGSLEDIEQLYKEVGLVGAAAGSLFVFKGKYRAVLINYPNAAEKQRLFESEFNIA